MTESKTRIQAVGLEFKNERTPYSSQFQDVYFAPESGIEESNYIYLEGSGFLKSLQEGAPKITLAEIGFGVGLNFLLTYDRFQRDSKADQELFYFSFEKYPVKKADLVRLYQSYPELRKPSDELLSSYPILTPGVHLLHFLDRRVHLYLCFGDAEDLLPRIHFKANHWYWDGFAPRTNADAFSETIFKNVLSHSAPEAVGASFTSAGWVRRGLENLGFKVEKRPGFANKRECLSARFQGTLNGEDLAPWFSSRGLEHRASKNSRVAVLGAGLGGSAIARALADRGIKVTVFDPNGIANRASGNPAGLFNTQLSKVPNPVSRFSQGSLAYLIREVKNRGIPTQLGIYRTDLTDPAPLQRSDYPEDFFEVREQGVYFPECGILNPQTLSRSRLDHPCIQFIPSSVSQVSGHPGFFQIHTGSGIFGDTFDHIVYALGADAKIPVSSKLTHSLHDLNPTRPIRGQIILVRPTPESSTLLETLVQEGYATPIAETVTGVNAHLIGATYQAKTIREDQEKIDTQMLVSESKKWKPFQNLTLDDVLFSRVGYRLSTPDKLPMIGPLCDPSYLSETYGKALRGAKTSDLPPLKAASGEWLLTGLGSRGVTFSSYAAELLTCLMMDEPLPIESDLWEHLHSSRFLVRNLRKAEIK